MVNMADLEATKFRYCCGYGRPTAIKKKDFVPLVRRSPRLEQRGSVVWSGDSGDSDCTCESLLITHML